MTPEQVLKRREARIDALVERVEGGDQLTEADWHRLDQLNRLDMMSADAGGVCEILEMEAEADGVIADGT